MAGRLPIESTMAPVEIPEGKPFLEGVLRFPVKDSGVVVAYLIETSFDGGNTWRAQCGAELNGAASPAKNERRVMPEYSFRVSHDGRPCLLRVRMAKSKEHGATLEIR